MLLLDNNGYIIGFNMEADDKPAPFPIDGVRWNGKEWEYPEWDSSLTPKRKEPPIKTGRFINAQDFQSLIQSVIYPLCGSYVKEKSDEITVLIPSYKKGPWVKDCVKSALNQTLKPKKIIILAMTDDDYSATEDITDPTVEVIRHERLNASAARNYLVEKCPTEYFVFLDADDELAENYLETVYKSKASIVASPFKNNWEEGVSWRMSRYSIASSNMTGLLNKECWKDVGGLRDDLAAGGEDSYFWNEIFRQRKWLVEWNMDTYLDYKKVDNESLTAKETENILSKEKEMYLHADWYKECLKSTFVPRYSELLDAYNDFLIKYGDGNDSGELIQIKLPAYNLDNDNIRNLVINRKWNAAINLFKESQRRDTSCVCLDKKHPLLFGRKFDLYVFAHPSLNWGSVKDSEGNDNSCYVNNKDIDLSMPTEELLKNYCVVFGTEHSIAGEKEPSEFEITKELNKESQIIRDEMKSKDWALNANIYSFCFFSKCDKQCPYCSQKKLDSNLDEDVLYNNFCEMVDKLESLHGKHWRPQLMGGEITLCSDSFAKKIIERVKDYNVLLVTNGHDYNKHIFYSYPNVEAYVHLTTPPFDDSFLRVYDTSDIVVNKADLPAILEAVEKHTVRKTCDFSLYVGNDERFRMSDDDIAILDEALKRNGYPIMSKRISGNVEICLNKSYLVRQANVYDKTIIPCCGRNEIPIRIEDWNCQPPCGKFCKGCTITAYR